MEYHGRGIARDQAELLALQIDPQHRSDEVDLMQSRWFDYRLLHPTEATYLFAHHYTEQTRAFYEQVVDIRTVEEVRGFVPADVFKSRDLTAMWIARRAADAIGAPYPFVLRFAHDRALERLYRTFPRPNQLYGEEFELDCADAWKELCGRSLQFSRLPHYQAANCTREPEQIEHARFVVAQIKARQAPHVGLLARAFREGVLHPIQREVVQEFGYAEIDTAESIWRAGVVSQN